MPRVKDLLHADRIFKMMDAGLSFKEAARMDDASAAYMIEAWEIAMACDCSDSDDGDGDVLMIVGTRE